MQKKVSIKSDFTEYKKIFIEKNHRLNLISKNDEKLLYEKHIYDSLSINLFFEKYKITSGTILDIGCGGGFPCLPIAIEYSNFDITGVDSIRKKILAVEEIKSELKIQNLSLICDRIENIRIQKFDIVTSRAVSNLANIIKYALPHVKRNGYIVIYKSKKVLEEIESAKDILQENNLKIIDIIQYTLPLEEIYERNLVVIKYV